jgi:hypothetical protein
MAQGQSAPDLDALFEYGLGRHLDGFAALIETMRQSVATESGT